MDIQFLKQHEGDISLIINRNLMLVGWYSFPLFYYLEQLIISMFSKNKMWKKWVLLNWKRRSWFEQKKNARGTSMWCSFLLNVPKPRRRESKLQRETGIKIEVLGFFFCTICLRFISTFEYCYFYYCFIFKTDSIFILY